VTRLRLRDPALLDEFFTAAVTVLEQAKNSHGNLGADVLADAHNTWWTLTAWQERDSIQAFMGTEPHLSTMACLGRLVRRGDVHRLGAGQRGCKHSAYSHVVMGNSGFDGGCPVARGQPDAVLGVPWFCRCWVA
jgi:hypothetical protein